MRGADALVPAIVHTRSHSRQRHAVAAVMTFARVSMIRPLQDGHATGRVTTASANGESYTGNFPFLSATVANDVHSGGSIVPYRGVKEPERVVQAASLATEISQRA
jgi:hypothetical protein